MARSAKEKVKKCKICKEEFTPYSSLSKTCSVSCSIELVKKANKKAQEAKVKAFNRETKARREKIKSRSDWLKEAQREFNKYIRLRDADKGCICCNNRKYDGQYHAGHYLSVGSHPELRFTEDNCHKQKSSCNNNKSGNQAQYRKYLIKKIGLERVEWLEGPHEPLKLTIEEIKEIKAIYTRKAKEIIDD